MKSLVSASVFLDDRTDIHELLMSLSGVRNLDLECPEKMVTIAKNTQWCPEFKNLVNLSLGLWCLDSKLYALTVFLKNSPKLEKLTLDPYEVIIDELEERSFECEHLKIVEVICLEGSPLLKLVEDFFVTSGMSSLQINRKSIDAGERENKDVYWSSTGREDSSTNENGDGSPVEDWSDDEYDGDKDDDDDDKEEEEEEETEDEYVDYSSSSTEDEGADKIIINITDITIEDEERRGSSSFSTDVPLSDPPRKPKPEPMLQPDQPSN